MKQLKARLKQKTELLKDAAKALLDCVSMGVAEWTTAALYQIGHMYEAFAKSLRDSPPPAEVKTEDQKADYQSQIEEFAVPMEERSLDAYENGWKEANKLGIYNQWTAKMRDALGRLNSELYPPFKETGFEVRSQAPLAHAGPHRRAEPRGLGDPRHRRAPGEEMNRERRSEGGQEGSMNENQKPLVLLPFLPSLSSHPRAARRSTLSSRAGMACGVSLFALALAACGGGKASAPKGAATLALPPANPIAVGKMVQGVQAAKDGQRDRATALLQEAIGLDANLWEARYDLGAILGNEGDLAGAEEQLAMATKLSPDSQDVAIALAEVRRRRGEQKEAADGLSDFVQDHPNAVDARTLFVASLRESGQIDKAIAEAREVLVRKPADASALAELSLSHLAKGEKEAAALLAKQALDSSPNSAVAHRATGLLDLANGDDAEAFAEFRKAAAGRPARHDVAPEHGRRAPPRGRVRQGRGAVPRDPQGLARRHGGAGGARGGPPRRVDPSHPQRLEEARSLLEKVLAADPHETSALFNLGVLYADFLKRPGDAAALFQAVPGRCAERPSSARRRREIPVRGLRERARPCCRVARRRRSARRDPRAALFPTCPPVAAPVAEEVISGDGRGARSR